MIPLKNINIGKNIKYFLKIFLFIHIHKTGGSSVKNFFQKNKGNVASHNCISYIIEEIGLKNLISIKL